MRFYEFISFLINILNERNTIKNARDFAAFTQIQLFAPFQIWRGQQWNDELGEKKKIEIKESEIKKEYQREFNRELCQVNILTSMTKDDWFFLF